MIFRVRSRFPRSISLTGEKSRASSASFFSDGGWRSRACVPLEIIKFYLGLLYGMHFACNGKVPWKARLKESKEHWRRDEEDGMGVHLKWKDIGSDMEIFHRGNCCTHRLPTTFLCTSIAYHNFHQSRVDRLAVVYAC